MEPAVGAVPDVGLGSPVGGVADPDPETDPELDAAGAAAQVPARTPFPIR
jgi:hypothetical protein